VIALFTTNSSTAVDRVALYMLPLQLVVFAHLPDTLARSRGPGWLGWVMAIVGYYFIVQFTWLTFGIHAPLWIPYRFFPLDG
jgi:hypothetical protein